MLCSGFVMYKRDVGNFEAEYVLCIFIGRRRKVCYKSRTRAHVNIVVRERHMRGCVKGRRRDGDDDTGRPSFDNYFRFSHKSLLFVVEEF